MGAKYHCFLVFISNKPGKKISGREVTLEHFKAYQTLTSKTYSKAGHCKDRRLIGDKVLPTPGTVPLPWPQH